MLADKEAGVWGDADQMHPIEHRASTSGSTARSTCRARRRAARCWCRPARRRTGATSPPATPRRSSPPSRRSRRPRRSTPTSRPGPPPRPRSGQLLGAARHRAGHRLHRGRGRALEEELDRLIQPEYARRQLARTLRVAPERLDLDEQLPDDLPAEDEIEGAKSRYTLVVNLARRERLTVRELIGRLGGGRGHRTFTGTPEQVADAIEEWFTSGAADGFNMMPPVLPSGSRRSSTTSCRSCRPRGLFRTEYTGTTLREHYGLDRPASQYRAPPTDIHQETA